MSPERPFTREHRDQLYRDATQLIAAEFARPLTVEGVALRLATSRRQLQRAFAESGGTSFRAQLRAVRLARAAALLTTTDLPIAEVGRRVGYQSAGQFSKAFKRASGESPSDLRDRASGAPQAGDVVLARSRQPPFAPPAARAASLRDPTGGGTVEIPKDAILKLIRERVGGEKADEADRELPDQVDPERDGDLLSRFGIDPKELLGGGLGGITGKLGL